MNDNKPATESSVRHRAAYVTASDTADIDICDRWVFLDCPCPLGKGEMHITLGMFVDAFECDCGEKWEG